MEHDSPSATIRQHQQFQENHQEQQQQHEHQQQFCLRWHNHQSSLLSTLPILLDQSHLTDVTISVEGRTLGAHRVVLSACSTFFLELFRALDSTNHPVIIIPGASFAAIVGLLTFMYSGEVNVYEEQIPLLLNLAETLGIKGLADVQNNKSSKRQTDFTQNIGKDDPEESRFSTTPPIFCSIPQQTQIPVAPTTSSLHPLLAPLLSDKLPTSLESLFLKTLQFYPSLIPQPLNFSQSALNKTTEMLAKYQEQCSLYQSALGMSSVNDNFSNVELSKSMDEGVNSSKRLCTGDKNVFSTTTQHEYHQQQPKLQYEQHQNDFKSIDTIGENFCCGDESTNQDNSNQNIRATQKHLQPEFTYLNIKTRTSHTPTISPHLSKSPLCEAMSTSVHRQQPTKCITNDDQAKLHQHKNQYTSCTGIATSDLMSSHVNLPIEPRKLASPQSKMPSNSKLYATCFICHKQLSNQYNLRVHLETHQNVRYACNVCSHVSRSKDALRKHVSYRHPGAPSPCETEARRKRGSKTVNASLPSLTPAPPNAISSHLDAGRSSSEVSAADSFQRRITQNSMSSTSDSTSGQNDSETQPAVAAAHITSAYMFLPNKFDLAPAPAQQQHIDTNKTNATITSDTVTSLSLSTAPFTARKNDFGISDFHRNMNIKTEISPLEHSSIIHGNRTATSTISTIDPKSRPFAGP